MNVTLKPAPFQDTLAITGLRLVGDSGEPRLVVSTRSGELRWLPAPEPAAGPVLAMGSRFGQPDWAVRPGDGGGISVVYSSPGSAISRIICVRSGQSEQEDVGERYPMGVFSHPRFVKGEPGDRLSVTAASDGDGGRELALFSRDARAGFGQFRKLPIPGDGVLQDALLLRHPNGYLLLAKLHVPGVAAPAHRVDPRGETVSAGILYGVELDDGLAPVGPYFRPVNNKPLLEFDADLTAGRLALFATTPAGFLLSLGQSRREGIQGALTTEVPTAASLSSPTIVAAGDRLHMAILESAAGKTRVLAGSVQP